MNKILNYYIGFLKSIDVSFKIIIRNEKFNKEEYINKSISVNNENIKKLDIYNKYVEDLKEKISKEKIYTSKMYICIACKIEEINSVEESLYKLNNLGLNIKKLNLKETFELLYKSINKI